MADSRSKKGTEFSLFVLSAPTSCHQLYVLLPDHLMKAASPMNAEIHSNDPANPVGHKRVVPIGLIPRYTSSCRWRAVDGGQAQESFDAAKERST